MKIFIETPPPRTVTSRGIQVLLAPRGTTWNEPSLGDLQKEQGVYVFHHENEIKYVGKTNGDSMNFGRRLRRHLQESAAGDHTYPRLAALASNAPLFVSLFPLADILGYVSFKGSNSSDQGKHIIEIFESALILALKPTFQTDV